MKTAVEWIEELIECGANLEQIKKCLPRAKEIFEEQIKEAHFDGKINGMDISHPLSIIKEITATDYYNETFKSEQNDTKPNNSGTGLESYLLRNKIFINQKKNKLNLQYVQ